MPYPIASLDDWLRADDAARAEMRVVAQGDFAGECNLVAPDEIRSLLLSGSEEELDSMRADGIDPSAPPDRMLGFTYSTGKRARDGHVIEQRGWVLGPYRKNPVILADHDYSVTSSVGRSRREWVDTEKDSLRGVVEFQPEDVNNGFGAMVHRLYRGRWLRSGSIGWHTLKWVADDGVEKERYGSKYSMRFTSQEMLEYSLIVVPSDPGALEGARSAGIRLDPYVQWAEKQLDGEVSIFAPRASLETVHRIASPVRDYFVQEGASMDEPNTPETTEAAPEVVPEPTRSEPEPEPTEVTPPRVGSPEAVRAIEASVLRAMHEAEAAEAAVMGFARDVCADHIARLGRMRDLLDSTISDLLGVPAEPVRGEEPGDPGRDPFHGLDPQEAQPSPEPEALDLRALTESAMALVRQREVS